MFPLISSHPSKELSRAETSCSYIIVFKKKKKKRKANEAQVMNQKLPAVLLSFPRETSGQMLAPSAKNNEKPFPTFSLWSGAGGKTSGDTTKYNNNSGLFHMPFILAKTSCWFAINTIQFQQLPYPKSSALRLCQSQRQLWDDSRSMSSVQDSFLGPNRDCDLAFICYFNIYAYFNLCCILLHVTKSPPLTAHSNTTYGRVCLGTSPMSIMTQIKQDEVLLG